MVGSTNFRAGAANLNPLSLANAGNTISHSSSASQSSNLVAAAARARSARMPAGTTSRVTRRLPGPGSRTNTIRPTSLADAESTTKTELSKNMTSRIRNAHRQALIHIRAQFSESNPEVCWRTQSPCTNPVEMVFPTGTRINPYSSGHGVVTVPPFSDPNEVCRALAMSGVSELTDYPLSTSPRMSPEAVQIASNKAAAWHGLEEHECTLETGLAMPTWDFGFAAFAIEPVEGFQTFSYDAIHQPRTAAARQEQGESVSPGTRPSLQQMSTEELVGLLDADMMQM